MMNYLCSEVSNNCKIAYGGANFYNIPTDFEVFTLIKYSELNELL